MEWYLLNALTVGELKKALADVPDDAKVGTSMSHVNGWITKANRVLYDPTNKIVSLDDAIYAGTFADDEQNLREMKVLATHPYEPEDDR
jgi:hypothetical protein